MRTRSKRNTQTRTPRRREHHFEAGARGRPAKRKGFLAVPSKALTARKRELHFQNEHPAQARAQFYAKRALKLTQRSKMRTASRRERNFQKKSAPHAGESAKEQLQTDGVPRAVRKTIKFFQLRCTSGAPRLDESAAAVPKSCACHADCTSTREGSKSNPGRQSVGGAHCQRGF